MKWVIGWFLKGNVLKYSVFLITWGRSTGVLARSLQYVKMKVNNANYEIDKDEDAKAEHSLKMCEIFEQGR